jgi:multidrug resistance protein, MATE family
VIEEPYSRHIQKTFLLAYPVAISQLGHMLSSVADSIMVGRLGSDNLAAAALANSIFSVILVFGIGASFGLTPLVATADGRKESSTLASLLNHGLVFNLSIAVLLFTLLCLSSPVLNMLSQPTHVVELAIPYFDILLLSLIPLMFFQNYKQFAEGLSHTRMAMIISMGSNLLNVGLNYILIYGKLGFPAMGLNGAGWATFISRVVMGVWMAWYVYRSHHFAHFRERLIWKKLATRTFRKLFRLGIPMGMQFTIEVSAFAIAAIMIGWMGAKELAAHQIAINLAAVTYMMASGISAASTVRVGNAVGRKDPTGLRKAGLSAFMIVIAFMAATACIFIIGNGFLPTLYVSEPDVIGIASVLLIVAAFFQLSDGVQVVGLGVLRGLHDVKVPTMITILAYWIMALPVGYVLGFKTGLGASGVWIGLLTGLTVAAVMLFVRFRLLSKRGLQSSGEPAT